MCLSWSWAKSLYSLMVFGWQFPDLEIQITSNCVRNHLKKPHLLSLSEQILRHLQLYPIECPIDRVVRKMVYEGQKLLHCTKNRKREKENTDI